MQFQALDVPSPSLQNFSSFQPSVLSKEMTPHRPLQDTSLTYLEDRLDREQKFRETLEAELRSGKNVMAQLNTKIEHLYNQSNLPLKSTEDQSSNLVRFEVKKDMERLNDGYVKKFEQVVIDQTLMKQRIDKSTDQSGKKIKLVLDEVDQLKHHLVCHFTRMIT